MPEFCDVSAEKPRYSEDREANPPVCILVDGSDVKGVYEFKLDDERPKE